MTAFNDERILELLRRNRQGLTLQHIFKELRVQRKERAKLEGRLIDLEARKLIRRVKNRYLLPLASDLVRGRFEASGRGFGFVVPEERGTGDVFVPARFAKSAMDGDTVEVLAKARGRNGRPEGRGPEGRVVRILKKEKKTVIGLYQERFGAPFLVPFDTASLEDVPLVSRGAYFPSPGMIVAADRSRLTLTDVFGFPDDPGVDAKVVIRKYGLPVEFSAEALREAEEAARRAVDIEGRADYRAWTTFTIDGETARDFDDAVSIRRLDNGHYLLGVHIADVSHFVVSGTRLDREAYERGTSVYFPDLTLPMLPERLSNDVCSLRPREDRLTVSAVMEIDETGTTRRAEFFPSVIRTAERLTYTAVFGVFQGDRDERTRLAAVVPDVLLMRELASLLRRRRVAAGSLDFDLVEPELVYEEGRLRAIASFAPNEAHKLIEEFMVAANVAVASYLEGRRVPSIYRVHPKPAVADLEKLRETLFRFGIILPKPEGITSKDLQAAIRAADGRAHEKFVNVQILRAMRLAVYSDENIGHYGLAAADYTHFTSPIRRYPDLVVHRILKEALSGRPDAGADLASIALHSSDRERRAAGAEENLVEWRIFRFLKGRLGEEFTGIVVDITRAGLVVELDEYFVRGLVAFQDLGGDDVRPRSRGGLSGKRSGRTYELGQSVCVTIAAVDPVLRRMSLVPAA
jgi:ribonuclease R